MSFFTRIIRFKIYPYAKINKKFNPRKEAVREKRKLDKRLKRNACYHLGHIGNFNSTCSTAYEKFAKIFLYTLLKRYYILEALKWFLLLKMISCWTTWYLLQYQLPKWLLKKWNCIRFWPSNVSIYHCVGHSFVPLNVFPFSSNVNDRNN